MLMDFPIGQNGGRHDISYGKNDVNDVGGWVHVKMRAKIWTLPKFCVTVTVQLHAYFGYTFQFLVT